MMPRGRLQVGGEWKGEELLLELHRAGECELRERLTFSCQLSAYYYES